MFHVLSIAVLIRHSLGYDCYITKCPSKPANPDFCNISYIDCDNALHKCEYSPEGKPVCVENDGPGRGIYCKGVHSCSHNPRTGEPFCSTGYTNIAIGVAGVAALCCGILAAGWSFLSQPKFSEVKVIQNPVAVVYDKGADKITEQGHIDIEIKERGTGSCEEIDPGGKHSQMTKDITAAV